MTAKFDAQAASIPELVANVAAGIGPALVGWSGLTDADGQAVPFPSENAADALLDHLTPGDMVEVRDELPNAMLADGMARKRAAIAAQAEAKKAAESSPSTATATATVNA